jgi:DNA-binding MarR family transcriptional regulator
VQKYVNMADVIADIAAPPSRKPAPDVADATPELALIELLFFAYRDFVSEPDAVLADYDFGRAHHRVLHFVNRQPGIRVADLLDILKITKQSLARVLKQLIDGGFIRQSPGETDRRERLLFTTDSGKTLAKQLVEMQSRRIRAALEAMPPSCRGSAAVFLRGIIDAGERDKVTALIGRHAEQP